MKKILWLLMIIFYVTACNNRGNDRIITAIKSDTVQNINRIDTILQVIRSAEKCPDDVDTTENEAVKIEFNTGAIKLNNNAIELYSYIGNDPLSLNDSLLIDSMLYLLNEAIKIDTQYYLAYANKAMVLGKYKKYNEAIETLNHVLRIRPNYTEGIVNQGFLYERIGNFDKAMEKYQEAIKAYLRRLNDHYEKNDKVNIQTDIAFILLFVEGREKALQFIDTIISRNPDNKNAKFMKQNIIVFDRKQFIDSF